jgi:hypothetical protein
MTKIDPLVQALLDCESRLSAWLNDAGRTLEDVRMNQFLIGGSA